MTAPTLTRDAADTATPATTPAADVAADVAADELAFDIRVFESGSGLAEIIRMTDDGCGSTCQSACTSC